MNTLLDQLKKGEMPEMPLSLRTDSLIMLGLVVVLSGISIMAAHKLLGKL